MTQNLKLKIEGMTCGSCSNSITRRLSKFDFTSNVNIDWENGEGSIDLDDPFEDNRTAIINAINQLGYKVVT